MTKTNVVMDIELLSRLTNYCHFIPQLNGQAGSFMDKNFPGWDWNDFVPRLLDKKILQFQGEGNPALTQLSQGLFISSDIQAIEFIPQKNGVRVKVQLKA